MSGTRWDPDIQPVPSPFVKPGADFRHPEKKRRSPHRFLEVELAHAACSSHQLEFEMRSIRWMVGAALLAPAGFALAQDLGDPECDSLILVSGYSNNAIKVYDGCSGAYVQDIADDNLLVGPQAIVDDGEGGLVVVSEGNGRLIRFDRATLTLDRVVAGDKPETATVEPPVVANPTGLAISDDGRWFVGSFGEDRVVEIDPDTGQVIAITIAPGQGLAGTDAGMWLDGNRLLAPGFDSDTIVAADITQNNAVSILAGPGGNGLNAPRTVIVDDQGDLIVTSWRGGQILAYNRNSGAFKRVAATVPRPTGITLESPGVALVASDQINDVKRVRLSDGAVLGTVIPSGSGGLSGATWVMVIDKIEPQQADNPVEDFNPVWLVGVGNITGNEIVADPVFTTRGGAWGADLDPAATDAVEWGSLSLTFDGCSSGTMTWDSDASEFGSGGYDIVRLAPSPLGDLCEEIGFENVEDDLWMSGHWYGGPDRDGEGFSIDVINGDLAIVTWYSYLPISLRPE